MRTTIWTGICTAAFSIATAAMAQPPQAPQSSASDHKITVTGCLRDVSTDASTLSGTAGTTGTSGTAGAAGSTATGGATVDQKFVLTNAATSSAATADQAPSTPAAPAYRLIANPTALAPHIGKKLELTGTIDDTLSASSPADAASPFANAPKLRVESGKIVGASCDK